MRLIIKYKDYYDTAKGYGIDETIIYDRKTHILNNHPKASMSLPTRMSLIFGNDTFTKPIVPYILGFCGKTYVVFGHNMMSDSIIGPERVPGLMWQYSSDLEKDGYNIFIGGDELFEYYENHPKVGERSRRDFKRWGEKEYKQFIADWDNKDNIDLFREFNTPVFAICHDRHTYQATRQQVVINPVLSILQWYRKFDAYQAFQEISMFLSGVLGNIEKETSNMSDLDKIASHGFDTKTSFRKDKTKK
jgi:hypothetical protein